MVELEDISVSGDCIGVLRFSPPILSLDVSAKDPVLERVIKSFAAFCVLQLNKTSWDISYVVPFQEDSWSCLLVKYFVVFAPHMRKVSWRKAKKTEGDKMLIVSKRPADKQDNLPKAKYLFVLPS